MSLPYPHFQVNCKTYPGTYGDGALKLAETLDRIASDTGGAFVLTPQVPDVRLVTDATDVPVTTPGIDPDPPGRGMGKLLPEALSAAGAVGAVINHAENRDTLADVAQKIERCREVGLASIVCVDSVKMGRAVAAFDPDQLLFERPGDIAGDRPIVETDPDRIEAFLAMRDEVAPETAVRLGGGISTAEHVRRAFELGVDATGAASAVATADNPGSLLRSIGEVVANVD